MSEIPKVSDRLLQRLRETPDADFPLILIVSGEVGDAAAALEQASVEVRRKLSLIRAVAVRASGRQALRLLDEPWLLRMEEDSVVRAL